MKVNIKIRKPPKIKSSPLFALLTKGKKGKSATDKILSGKVTVSESDQGLQVLFSEKYSKLPILKEHHRHLFPVGVQERLEEMTDYYHSAVDILDSELPTISNQQKLIDWIRDNQSHIVNEGSLGVLISRSGLKICPHKVIQYFADQGQPFQFVSEADYTKLLLYIQREAKQQISNRTTFQQSIDIDV